jgi:hypothetical protein
MIYLIYPAATMLDVGTQHPGISSAYAHVPTSDKLSSYVEDETEHAIELAGVESGISML